MYFLNDVKNEYTKFKFLYKLLNTLILNIVELELRVSEHDTPEG